MRGLWWKICIESARSLTPRSTALGRPPAVETWAPISTVSQNLRFRFAPSPTGALHIGGARTALYNWLAARGSGGELVLRIEDTDRERSTEENVQQILDALEWLELDWDEGPVSQASRAEQHAERLAQLLASGAAYRDGAVAVDDAEMGVTDVVRGDDHLSNTPKQLLVMKALGIEPPRYAHLPLLHGPDGKKLSKRHGAASVQELRDMGYLPAAVRNYLALLGWGLDESTTFISTDELIKGFSLDRVNRAPAVFDEQKL